MVCGRCPKRTQKKDLRKCRFSESELIPSETALSRSFSVPKQNPSGNTFKNKCPDVRGCRVTLLLLLAVGATDRRDKQDNEGQMPAPQQ